MSAHKYVVEFRIYSWSLNRDVITRELGIRPNPPPAPQFPRRSGPRIWATRGVEPSDDNPDPYPAWDSLEKGLAFVLDRLWPHREAIARYNKSGELIWWCVHFQTSFDGGPTLFVPLLKRLGEFGVEVYIDNYHSRDVKVGMSETYQRCC